MFLAAQASHFTPGPASPLFTRCRASWTSNAAVIVMSSDFLTATAIFPATISRGSFADIPVSSKMVLACQHEVPHMTKPTASAGFITHATDHPAAWARVMIRGPLSARRTGINRRYARAY